MGKPDNAENVGFGYIIGKKADIVVLTASYIRAGYYKEAINVLNQMTDRNAQWYYYSAMANRRWETVRRGIESEDTIRKRLRQ